MDSIELRDYAHKLCNEVGSDNAYYMFVSSLDNRAAESALKDLSIFFRGLEYRQPLSDDEIDAVENGDLHLSRDRISAEWQNALETVEKESPFDSGWLADMVTYFVESKTLEEALNAAAERLNHYFKDCYILPTDAKPVVVGAYPVENDTELQLEDLSKAGYMFYDRVDPCEIIEWHKGDTDKVYGYDVCWGETHESESYEPRLSAKTVDELNRFLEGCLTTTFDFFEFDDKEWQMNYPMKDLIENLADKVDIFCQNYDLYEYRDQGGCEDKVFEEIKDDLQNNGGKETLRFVSDALEDSEDESLHETFDNLENELKTFVAVSILRSRDNDLSMEK